MNNYSISQQNKNSILPPTRVKIDGLYYWSETQARIEFQNLKESLIPIKTEKGELFPFKNINENEFEFNSILYKLEKTNQIMENKSIHEKLLEFQTSVEAIKKDGQNTFFKKPNGHASTYATLPNILSEVKPILNALKLVLTQPIKGCSVFSIITDTETKESIESWLDMPNGLNAQQTGSAVTYFRRYTLSSLLGLEIDEDDDGNLASGNKEKPKYENKETTFQSDQKKNDITNWLDEKAYKAMIEMLKSGDDEQIARAKEGYAKFTKAPNGMKKIYKDELDQILKSL